VPQITHGCTPCSIWCWRFWCGMRVLQFLPQCCIVIFVVKYEEEVVRKYVLRYKYVIQL
jgi:hypothetical protein